VAFDIDVFGTQKCHSATTLDWLGCQTDSHTVAPIYDKITIFGHGVE
jgi:hypothetical protein